MMNAVFTIYTWYFIHECRERENMYKNFHGKVAI